jgi:hypothetical protein
VLRGEEKIMGRIGVEDVGRRTIADRRALANCASELLDEAASEERRTVTSKGEPGDQEDPRNLQKRVM